MTKLTEANSILLYVERLDSHALTITAPTAVAVYCTLGGKTIKSASAPAFPGNTAPLDFESLLQFPFDSHVHKNVLFQLKEKSTQKELGKYTLDLQVFADNDKPSHLVRTKLKANDKGIGYLDMKLKFSENVLEKPSSMKYVKNSSQSSPVTSASVADVIPEFDPAIHTVRHLKATIYKVEPVPLDVKLGFICVKIGDVEASIAQEQPPAQAAMQFNKTAKIPYKYPNRFLHCILQDENRKPLGSGEMDLSDFLTKRANVYTGCMQIDLVQPQQTHTKLFLRLERCSTSVSEVIITDETDFTGSIN